jgi:hypothetical protein
MAIESVTLSMEDVRRIQDRLLVGLASFAEIDRVRGVIQTGGDLEKRLKEERALPMITAAGDDEYGEFATALHILHIASTP